MQIYRFLTFILYPLLILLIFFRRLIKKEDVKRYKEKIFPSHFNISRNFKLKLFWFHAASIGEMKSIIPIIKEINKKEKKIEILVTTVTLSSSNLAQIELKKFGNVFHRFFPLDVEFLIRKFILAWKPSVILLVDSEIWPNLIYCAKKKKIPIGIINGRLTKKTFKRWMIFPRFAYSIFSNIEFSLSSNNETHNYLSKLKVKNTYFTGNIKLISTPSFSSNFQNERILNSKKFWIAASTHKDEEIFCLKTHLKLKEKIKDIVTIIAPRHIDRINEINKLCLDLNLIPQILSKNEKIEKNKDIIIINSFGDLNDYFKYAKSVFIGKSNISRLKNEGGQNPIDAANLGCKIYHGPYVYNFSEIYEIFQQNNISEIIMNPDELAEKIFYDLESSDKDIKKYSSIMSRLREQTLNNTMKHINNFLFNENI